MYVVSLGQGKIFKLLPTGEGDAVAGGTAVPSPPPPAPDVIPPPIVDEQDVDDSEEQDVPEQDEDDDDVADEDDQIADNEDEVDAIMLGTGFGGITDIETGPDGYLYILSYQDSRVYRLTNPQ